jgi:trimeric autotransporter adhesin
MTSATIKLFLPRGDAKSLRTVLKIAVPCVWSVAALLLAPAIAAQSIFTVAGGGIDDGRPATVAAINSPQELAFDREGGLLIVITSADRIRRVDIAKGVISLVAGNGFEGYEGDGGPATKAKLSLPWAVASDSDGNIYITDGKNCRIRRVDPGGTITTFAGAGCGFSGDGGPATAAKFSQVVGLALDSAGNLYLADGWNHRIRRIDRSSGVIATVAGGGTSTSDGVPATEAEVAWPEGVATDSDGNLYIVTINSLAYRVDASMKTIRKIAGSTYGFSGDGGPATAAQLGNPEGVFVDAARNIYIADTNNHRIRRIDAASGIITTVAGSGPTGSNYGGFDGDGGAATAARLNQPTGVAVDVEGNLYIADSENNRVRRVDAESGIITSFAGNGNPTFLGDSGPATAALLSIDRPYGLPGGTAVDAAGNLYIADSGVQRVRRVDATTKAITTVAGNGELGSKGDGGAALSAELSNADDVAVDREGRTLYIAEFQRVRVVDLDSGIIRAFAGTSTEGFSGDGGPATMAQLRFVNGMTVDSAGNLYIADTSNFRIRRVDRATGLISTLTMGGYRDNWGWSRPVDVAVDEARGVVYVLQDQNAGVHSYDWHASLIQFDPATAVRTTLVETLPGYATSMDLGPDGALYFSDGGSSLIRRLDIPSKSFTTIAGNGTKGFSGDDGPALAAEISPSQVTVDRDGGIYFANAVGNRIRYVPPCVDLAAPALVEPSDLSSSVVTAPRLAWRRVAGARRYEVLLDTVNPPAKVVATDLDSLSFSPTNLLPLTTYYWQIIARSDPFCDPPRSKSSPVRSFTTRNACTSPNV